MSMTVFFDEAHRKHAPKVELYGGEPVEPFERPVPHGVHFSTNSTCGASATFVVRTGLIRPPWNCCMNAGYLEFLRIALGRVGGGGVRGRSHSHCVSGPPVARNAHSPTASTERPAGMRWRRRHRSPGAPGRPLRPPAPRPSRRCAMWCPARPRAHLPCAAHPVITQ